MLRKIPAALLVVVMWGPGPNVARASAPPSTPASKPEGPAAPVPGADPVPGAAARKASAFSPLAYGLLGVGVAGLFAGAGFGISSAARTRAAKAVCTQDEDTVMCPTAAALDLQVARRHALASDVLFAVGAGALVAMATVLIVRTRRGRRGGVAARARGGGQATLSIAW